MSTPEGDLKAAVVTVLNQLGYLWFRMQSGRVRVKRGWLHLHKEGTGDILVFPLGRVCWVELKAKGQKTLKERVEAQAEFGNKVRAIGHEYQICETTDEVIDYLKGVI